MTELSTTQKALNMMTSIKKVTSKHYHCVCQGFSEKQNITYTHIHTYIPVCICVCVFVCMYMFVGRHLL